jgi:hypothetical protein
MDINYQYGFFIDTSPIAGGPIWAEIAAGINDYKKSLNEVVQSYQYLSNNGWGASEVLGGQIITTFTGNRVRGDAAQDYIYSVGVQYGFGSARKTNYKIVAPDGSTIQGACTLVKVEDTGGKSVEATAISFDVNFNGLPTFSPGLGTLSIVSLAGPSVAGTTSVYINPAKAGGNSYKYQTSAAVVLPGAGAILTTGWTAWDGSAVITAVTGNQIVVAEVTAANAAVKAGIAVVTAHP